ncbi:MAG: glycosyltransferase family 2 protein [Muribaculaceae bacterium]|nr:glycosyltransferase family 2 protein [Muribaculaceae bacterium]
MDSSPSVSVGVAIYNKEKVLRRCLDSLKNQSLQDIEFILVDDGSTDGSRAICEEYSKADPRFKTISTPNGGLGKARQTALNNARGEYIIHCDADDWVEPTAYEKAYKTAKEKNADVVIFNFFKDNDATGESSESNFQTSETESSRILLKLLLNNNNSSWGKLVRMSVIKENGLYFEPGINSGEDALFTCKVLSSGPLKVEFINDCLYHYCYDPEANSLSHYYNLATIHNQIFILDWMIANINYGELESLVWHSRIGKVSIILRSKEYDGKLFSDYMKRYLPWKTFRKVPVSLKWFIALFAKIFGIKFTYKLIHAIKK